MSAPGWIHVIEAAILSAANAGEPVSLTWEGVTVSVNPGDSAADVRRRWRAERDWRES